MSEPKKSGLIPRVRLFLYGAASTPKARRYTTTTPSETTPDTSLTPVAYRWFRRDELVRRCVVLNASFATFAAGFETELEPIEDISEDQKVAYLEQYAYVKKYVDQINKQVNMDQVLFVAQVKRSVYGKCGFEIVLDSKGAPNWLLSLQSEKLKPEVTADWSITGFEYDGTPAKYTKEGVLYFVNLELENDHLGCSDIEPVAPVCSARHTLLKTDFPEITRKLWAPYTILKADTSAMEEADENQFMTDLTAAAEAGQSLAVNKSVEATVVAMNINLDGLIRLMDKLEESIIRAFGTPRFLLNKPTENRAVAYTDFEAYIQGPVAAIQRYFKRELEAQWYTRLVKAALTANGFSGEVPVQVKHVWKPIRANDVYDMANAVTALYGNGLGLLAEFPDIAFDMLGLDKKRLTEWQKQQPPIQQPQPQPTPKTEQQQTEETVKPNA